MSMRNYLLELIRSMFDPGDEFTLADIRKAMQGSGGLDKTMMNRLGELPMLTDEIVRIKPGRFLLCNPSNRSSDLLRRGDNLIRRNDRFSLGGKRAKMPKTERRRRELLRKEHLADGVDSPLWKVSCGICALCGGDMLRPMHAAIDHVRSLQSGGDDIIANCVLVHAACNSVKSTAPREEVMDLLDARGDMISRRRADISFKNQMQFNARAPDGWLRMC